ncbi:hypothetical protein [Hansschlegelia beijingensis]
MTKLARDLDKADHVHTRTGEDGRERLEIEKDGRFFEVSEPAPTGPPG